MTHVRTRLLIAALGLFVLLNFAFLPYQFGVASIAIIVATGTIGFLAVLGDGFMVVWIKNWRRRKRLPLQLAYLPNFPTIQNTDQSTLVFAGNVYRVYVSARGVVELRDLNERPFVQGIRYYSQTDEYEVDGMEAGRWQIQPEDQGELLTLVGEVRDERVTIEFEFDRDRPMIKVQTCVEYLTDVRVKRSALIWDMALPLSEVYRPSGARITHDFESSYWLDRQGAMFGQRSHGIFISHVPDVSSLQIDTGRNRLWVNLDYERDHPYISIPFRQDGTAKWQDASAAEYSAGQSRCNQWEMIVGDIPALRPRVSSHPHGYCASMVWTEHACHASMEAHRAVYFGSGSIECADEAIAGFVKHRIPVTKSVHYSNVTNVPASSGDSRPMVSICSDDKEFLYFLEDLQQTGDYEICLHCTDAVSSDREQIEESLRFMQERFGCTTWIDHIWCRPDGIVNGCRESFSCEGPIRGSKGYIADLWRRYNIGYFWNSAFEYMFGDTMAEKPLTNAARAGRGLRNVREYLHQKRLFTASEEFWRWMLQWRTIKKRSAPGWAAKAADSEVRVEDNFLRGTPFYFMSLAARACGYPNPNFFQHPTVTGEFYHWTSWCCEPGLRPAEQWDAAYSEAELARFIEFGETRLMHAYPTLADRMNGCTRFDSSGVRSIAPEFDAVLARMARLRDEGKLYLGTIRELLDFRRRLAKVKLSYDREGALWISNQSEETIEGFTLAFDSPSVKFDDTKVNMKRSHGDWLYWFDLPAKGHVCARTPNTQVLLREAA